MPETAEDILRELLHRATDDLHAPSAIPAGIVSRHHRRLRNTRILSITTTSVAAAAVVVASVAVTRTAPSTPSHERSLATLPATQLPPVKLTAVQVLDQLSVAAAHAPPPAGRYIALTEIREGPTERTTVFDGLTGDVWTYQHGGDGPGELPVARHWSPTRAEFAAWPTNPVKLRSLLLSPGGQTLTEGAEGAAEVSGETPDDLIVQEATNWLWNPLLSPALRAAMYKVLAATAGVAVKAGTTDADGRPAIEISQEGSSTFESPSTGVVLEQDFSDAGSAVYVSVTGYATRPANPYGG